MSITPPVFTAYTKDYMDTIINKTIVDGTISGDDLVLEKYDGSFITIASVIGVDGPPGPTGPTGLFQPYAESASLNPYELHSGLIGYLFAMDYSVANTLTVPINTAWVIPIGSTFQITQKGTGTTTIAPASGVTLLSYSGMLKSQGQNSRILLEKSGTNEWYVSGDLTT